MSPRRELGTNFLALQGSVDAMQSGRAWHSVAVNVFHMFYIPIIGKSINLLYVKVSSTWCTWMFFPANLHSNLWIYFLLYTISFRRDAWFGTGKLKESENRESRSLMIILIGGSLATRRSRECLMKVSVGFWTSQRLAEVISLPFNRPCHTKQISGLTRVWKSSGVSYLKVFSLKTTLH